MNKIENSDWKRLTEKWHTEGRMLNSGNGPEASITGTDSYELILDGNFILHKANVMMGDAKSETCEIIGPLDSGNKVNMSYFNAAGEHGSMQGHLSGNVLEIKGENLRFKGHLSDDDASMSGIWQQRSDNDHWSDFLEMKLSRSLVL